jgi:hypothetical protein
MLTASSANPCLQQDHHAYHAHAHIHTAAEAQQQQQRQQQRQQQNSSTNSHVRTYCSYSITAAITAAHSLKDMT